MTAPSIGLVGLGRMGGNMARRLSRGGIRVVGHDATPGAADALAAEGVLSAASSPAALVDALPAPRVVWTMVPAGSATETTIATLSAHLAPGDTIVDGGNANYRDSQRRAQDLAARRLLFVDCGVSGGVWGLANGYTLMFGGSAEGARAVEPFVRVLAPAPDAGWMHCGPAGAGHFAKMIHNGIEYGMMQAYAEGFALLKGKREFGIDVARLAETWRRGSVVRSWLLDLTAEFLASDADLDAIAPHVADSGEGRWTVAEAIEQGTPAPVLAVALMNRFASQGKGDYANRMLARMRQAFGGHAVQGAGAGPKR
ncbi:MAG: decarboxylating 6-phosphogluconate dehydrogenase [Burkholderiales bacterium]|nr:decarboxylating 6-phosphogluconate dehydrogenase [Burkholderiales bacterium]